jgi:hypothetical protein
MYVTPSSAGRIVEPSGAGRVRRPYRMGSVLSSRWLCPCTTRSTWYLLNSGSSLSRRPPSEAWLLVVEYAQWWKNATTKSTVSERPPCRHSFSVSSSHLSWAPPE